MSRGGGGAGGARGPREAHRHPRHDGATRGDRARAARRLGARGGPGLARALGARVRPGLRPRGHRRGLRAHATRQLGAGDEQPRPSEGARGRSDWKRRSEPTKARAVSASILSGKAAALPIAEAAPAARYSGALLCLGTGCKAGLWRLWQRLRTQCEAAKRLLVGFVLLVSYRRYLAPRVSLWLARKKPCA